MNKAEIFKQSNYYNSETHLENARVSIEKAKQKQKETEKLKQEEYEKNPKKCKQCGTIIPYNKRTQNSFCSGSCSALYNNKLREPISQETKDKIRNTLLSKNTKQKFCPSCGVELNKTSKFKYCGECKKFSNYKTLFDKLDITISNFQDANKEALIILSKEYFTNKQSKIQILEKYGIMSNTLYYFFKKNGISLRSLSQATTLAIEENRSTIGNFKNQYHTGYHTTWYGTTIWYRSSYEKKVMEILDEKKELYYYELIKIKYIYENEEKIHVTDLYLPERNLIIEVKSEYFYKKEEEKNKAKKLATIKEGYYHMLLLEEEIKQLENHKNLDLINNNPIGV